MSSSDDSFEQSGEPPEEEPEYRPKKTLAGMGLKVPRPPRPDDATDSKATPEESEPDDEPNTRPADGGEFADEATQIAEHLADEVMEDIDSLLDGSSALSPSSSPSPERSTDTASADDEWEEIFPDEKTEISEHELVFPADELPAVEVLPSDDEGGAGSHAAGFDEDSLPAPIRPRVPTLDDPLQVKAATPTRRDQPPVVRPPEPPQAAAFRGYGDDGSDADSDDDFHGGKTELLDSPFESDPAVARLVVLDGPATGQEVFVSSLRNTIGRGTNNSIVISDLAMSRQHFEIVKNPDESFALRDLQSVNGTVLNGTKVREADLIHGDRIEAGKSLFQFVVTGISSTANRQRRVVPAANATLSGQPAPMPAPNKRPADRGSLNRVLLWVSLAAVLVSLLLIAGIFLIRLQQRAPAPQQPQEPGAASVYLEGVEAVKAREWDDAQRHFVTARELDPTLDGVEDQLRRIEMERRAQADLRAAAELSSQEMYDRAVAKIHEIPRDSIYYADAQELLREGRKAAVESLYTDAQRALTEEKLDEARAAIGEILVRVPTHQGASDLQDRLDAIAKGEQTLADAAQETKQAREERTPKSARLTSDDDDGADDWGIDLLGAEPGSSKKRREKSSTPGARVPNFTSGFLLYRTRKFDEAETFFAEAANAGGPAADRADRIARAIGAFNSSYTAANTAFERERWDEAEQQLKAARNADSVVGKYFDSELGTKLATVRANLGLARLAAGDHAVARKYYQDALQLNADDRSTRQLGSELDKEARSLYVKALNQRKTDPAGAAKLCRTIKLLVPTSHSVYQKADSLLKSL